MFESDIVTAIVIGIYLLFLFKILKLFMTMP